MIVKKWTRWYFHGDLSDYGHGFFCRNCNGFFLVMHFAGCNPAEHEKQLELTERELTEAPERWRPENAVNIFQNPLSAYRGTRPGGPKSADQEARNLAPNHRKEAA